MLKRILALCLSVGILAGCQGINLDNALSAGEDLYKAANLSDEEVQQLGKESAVALDKQNKVLGKGNKYTKRLNKITAKLKNEDGLKLNYKVYQTSDINAFALPDGSVRVYSGLMDLMTDDEIFFVIGHEVGHVKDGDAADRFRMAYVTSGVRKAAASAGGTAGAAAAKLSASQLGDISEKFIHAQFSQSQESDADAYGFKMVQKYKKDQKAAVSALRKLADPSRKSSMFDSHPDSNKRADKLEAMIK